jgi:regulator of nonsense transcripts 1
VKHYYRALDFCIITPYDAQRAAIQAGLKAENLPWETVFNVDSFQGKPLDS